jgi:hypothetical protein
MGRSWGGHVIKWGGLGEVTINLTSTYTYNTIIQYIIPLNVKKQVAFWNLYEFCNKKLMD